MVDVSRRFRAARPRSRPACRTHSSPGAKARSCLCNSRSPSSLRASCEVLWVHGLPRLNWSHHVALVAPGVAPIAPAQIRRVKRWPSSRPSLREACRDHVTTRSGPAMAPPLRGLTGVNRRQLRSHGLRGTFVTLSLANGKQDGGVGAGPHGSQVERHGQPLPALGALRAGARAWNAASARPSHSGARSRDLAHRKKRGGAAGWSARQSRRIPRSFCAPAKRQ